jgi:uncharacterized protein (TIGR02099 family)
MGRKSSTLTSRIFHFVVYFIATLIVILALSLNAARIFLPRIHGSRIYLEKWASAAVSRPVSFSDITARWRGIGPVFQFNNVVIHSTNKDINQLKINQLDISISWWQSILNRRLVPGKIQIVGTKFNVQQLSQKKYLINNVPIDLTTSGASEQASDFSWLFHTGFVLSDCEVYLQDMHANTIHLSPVQLAVRSDGGSDLIAGVFTLKQTVPTSVRFNLQIDTTALRHNKLHMQAYFAGKKVSLLQWQNFVGSWATLKEKVRGGNADMQFWVNVNNGNIKNVISNINLHYFGLQGWHLKQGLFFPNVKINSTWTALKDGWLLDVSKLHAHLPGLDWPDNAFSLQQTTGQHGKVKRIVNLSFLRLQDIPVIEKQITGAPADVDMWLKRFKPSGDVHDLRVVWNQGEGIDSLQARLDQASWVAWDKVPGMTNVDISLKTSRKLGSFVLTSAGGSIYLPHLFAHSLQYKSLAIPVIWNMQKDGWQLKSNYSFSLPGIQARGDVRVSKHHESSPVVDFLSGFKVSDAGQVRNLFPKKVMSKKLYNWLDNAFISGKVTSGTMLLRGPLASFPYLDKSGHFEVLAHVADMDLHYRDHWPDMLSANAKLLFDNRSMHADLLGGNLNGMQVENGWAKIDNMQDSHLYVSANLKGDLGTAGGYLRKTPLDIAKTFKSLDFSGPSTLALNLDLPLNRKGKRHSSGVIVTKDARLFLNNWKLSVDHFAGTLKFHDKVVSSKKLTATIFDRPAVISIATKKHKKSSYLQVKINGAYSGKSLRKYLQLDGQKLWTGNAKFNALLNVYSGSNPSSLNVVVDGAGNEFDLPGYFYKKASDRTQININLLMQESKKVQLKISYGRRWNLAALMSLSSKYSKFKAMNFVLGAKKADTPKNKGISVSGYVPSINYDAWKVWLDKNKFLVTVNKSRHDASIIRKIDLSIGKLVYGKHKFSKIALVAQPIARSWRVSFSAPVASGEVLVPNDLRKGIVKGTLNHLNLKSGFGSTGQISFDKLPNLSVNIDSLAWNDNTYGGVSIESRSWPNHFKLLRLVTRSSKLNFNGSGSWDKVGRVERSHLIGVLKSTDFGSVLEKYKFTNLLDDGAGYVQLDLSWPDGLAKVKDSNLTGNIKVNITDGRITKISKQAESEMGVGRVLSLLSLQTLPRRLTLNFDDLFKSGYSFNSWTGDWVMQKGIAKTNNSVVEGPVAKVLLQGQLDFPSKTYDLFMRVQPHLTGSLPVIATVIGTPIAGAITWAFNKILINPLVGRVMQSSFQLKGSWDNPKLKKLPAPRSHKTNR